MKTRRILLTVLLVLIVAGAWYQYVSHLHPFPPKDDECFTAMMTSIEGVKMNASVTVPDFSLGSVTSVRCTAIPGFTHFEITGTDTAGKDFQVYEMIGGKAASGADSIFDYCYLREGDIVSQTRVTGREGNVSVSACTYDERLLPHAEYQYEYTQ